MKATFAALLPALLTLAILDPVSAFAKDDDFTPAESATPFKISDDLTVYAEKLEPASDPETGALVGLVATGRVVVALVMEDYEELVKIRCESALYRASTGEVLLQGNPKVRRGSQTLTSTSEETYVKIDPVLGKLDIVGPHKIELSLKALKSATEGKAKKAN